MRKCFVLSFIFILYIFPSSVFALSTQVIVLPTDKLGMPPERLSYTMGVGDFNGDSKYDYLTRVWIDDEIDKNFKTITYAYLNDGTFLWEFHHNLSYSDIGGDPTWTATLSVWDMDGDGKDEVITQRKEGSQVKLVILDGMTGVVEKDRGISMPKKANHQTIAYLDGKDPYIVRTYGNPIQTVAYDKNLNEYWRFSDLRYQDQHSWTNIYTYDFDNDGKDEIVNGPLLIDNNGTLYVDGTKFYSPQTGHAERSFIADIDPDNPGYEWYLIRGGVHTDPYYVQPNYWEGPYLIDVDQKKVIWHHNIDQPDQGWGRMHRGWVGDVNEDRSGLEMFATGYFWEGEEWQNALNGEYGAPPLPDDVWVDGYSEKYFLFDAKGDILKKVTGTYVGYPVHWDDDPEAEYFRYRSGILLNKFGGSTLQSGMARAYGSGESIEVDIKGDWREEIVLSSGYKLYVYSNNDSTVYPNRVSPRTDHNYLMNMASVGTGLPKNISFDLGIWTNPRPTSTPAPGTPGDLDKDGDVDIFDYNILIENFSNTSCGNIADIDGDCKVDIFDYNILIENFGKNA